MMDALYPWLSGLWSSLQSQYHTGRFPHGLLLSGPEGVGKDLLLAHLSRFLLCQNRTETACGHCSACQLYEAGTHPDLLRLDGSEKKIGVEEVRNTIRMLSEKAHQQGARVVIVHAAHQMTENAANALLKTLEEPGEESYLLLDAPSSGNLLATITSRCQVEHLAEPDSETAMAWLNQQGVTAELMHLRINRNAPLKVVRYFEQELNIQCESFIHRLNLMLRDGMVQEELVKQLSSLGDTAFDWLWFYLADLQKASASLPAHSRVFVEHAAEQDLLIQQRGFRWFELGLRSIPKWRELLTMQGINRELQLHAMLTRWCHAR